ARTSASARGASAGGLTPDRRESVVAERPLQHSDARAQFVHLSPQVVERSWGHFGIDEIGVRHTEDVREAQERRQARQLSLLPALRRAPVRAHPPRELLVRPASLEPRRTYPRPDDVRGQLNRNRLLCIPQHPPPVLLERPVELCHSDCTENKLATDADARAVAATWAAA